MSGQPVNQGRLLLYQVLATELKNISEIFRGILNAMHSFILYIKLIFARGIVSYDTTLISAPYTNPTYSLLPELKVIQFIIEKNNINIKKVHKLVKYRYDASDYFIYGYENVLAYIGNNLYIYTTRCSRLKENVEFEKYTYNICSFKFTRNEICDIIKKYSEELTEKLQNEKPILIDIHVDNCASTGTIGKDAQLSLVSSKQNYNTTKSFDNIFFKDKEYVIRSLEYFINNKSIYEKRGLSYTLGFLLYGDPGCGKTSCIKAIQNYTKRSIEVVNLRNIKTCGDFHKVFYDTELNFNIPIDRKIIVLEDIDCMSDIIKNRETSPVPENITSETKSEITLSDIFSKSKSTSIANNLDKITLSYILNIIDGINEMSGRIMIITTNHPELIDPALIRAGRIDIKINFTYCTNEDAVNIINNTMGLSVSEVTLTKHWTPADLINHCFNKTSLAELSL